MAKLMTVQDWIPEHPYPEPIFFLTSFTPGTDGLSKVECQRQREKCVRGFWRNVSNSKEGQIQAKSRSQLHLPVGSN